MSVYVNLPCLFLVFFFKYSLYIQYIYIQYSSNAAMNWCDSQTGTKPPPSNLLFINTYMLLIQYPKYVYIHTKHNCIYSLFALEGIF